MHKKDINFFDSMEELGLNIDDQEKRKIINRINEILSYQPKIGIMGKTGAGKSSLCNTLFGADVVPISDIRSCTRMFKKFLLISVQIKALF